jgi:hypothetical protein
LIRLGQQLAGQVLLADRHAESQPSDANWVRVASGVIVPPRLG